MKLLLISNSTNAGEQYLEHAMPKIDAFLGREYSEALFIPYAIVTDSFNNYEKKVKEKFAELGYNLTSIHRYSNPVQAIEKAEIIVIGGGNTFALLQRMYEAEIISLIRKKIMDGVPYIGWSAGANVASPTIMTTNDMPIIEPKSFKALNLIKFQINPHYTEKTIPNHGGETRDDRLREFITINKDVYVVALREGTALEIIDNKIRLVGEKKAKIFKYGIEPYEVDNKASLTFLLS